MPTFYKWYSITVYLAFVIFVAKESPKHPDPILFSLLFLSIWPFITILVGYQGVVHARSEYKTKYETELPNTWPNSLRHGIICGAVFGILSLSILWLPFLSPVYLGFSVFYALFGPGIGISISLWRWHREKENQ